MRHQITWQAIAKEYFSMCYEASDRKEHGFLFVKPTIASLNIQLWWLGISKHCYSQENKQQIFFCRIFILFDNFLESVAYPTEVARKNKRI